MTQALSSDRTASDRRLVSPQVESAVRLLVNSLAVFTLSGVLGLSALAVGPRLLGFDTVVVGSGSMEPSLRTADVVVLADPDDRLVEQGSVINYRLPPTPFADVGADDPAASVARGAETRIHRVVEVVPDAGYRTKGDANPTADVGLVEPERVTGIGIYLVPVIGLPSHWLAQGAWGYLALSAVVLAAATYFGRQAFVEGGSARHDERFGPVSVRRRIRAVRS